MVFLLALSLQLSIATPVATNKPKRVSGYPGTRVPGTRGFLGTRCPSVESQSSRGKDQGEEFGSQLAAVPGYPGYSGVPVQPDLYDQTGTRSVGGFPLSQTRQTVISRRVSSARVHGHRALLRLLLLELGSTRTATRLGAVAPPPLFLHRGKFYKYPGTPGYPGTFLDFG
eukprot:2479015-Rhodomonas_salina.2